MKKAVVTNFPKMPYPITLEEIFLKINPFKVVPLGCIGID